MSSIKIISNFAVGFGNIDIEAAKKKNIIVTNTPDVLTDATAEIAILLILGASVGCRFAGKTLKEVYLNTKHSIVATLLLVLFSVIAAYAATFIIDNNFFSLLLAYCPGGIYEVAVIAIAFDLDPDFVSFHHIIRLLIILFIIPVILKLVDRKKI